MGAGAGRGRGGLALRLGPRPGLKGRVRGVTEAGSGGGARGGRGGAEPSCAC